MRKVRSPCPILLVLMWRSSAASDLVSPACLFIIFSVVSSMCFMSSSVREFCSGAKDVIEVSIALAAQVFALPVTLCSLRSLSRWVTAFLYMSAIWSVFPSRSRETPRCFS